MERFDRRTLVQRGGSLGLAAWMLPRGRLATIDGRSADPRLRSLQGAVRGRLFTPGSPGYAQARLVYNERYDGVRPLAVLRCADVADVRAAVSWAQRTGVALTARSGGHSYAGYSTGTGLVVDLSLLRGMRIEGDGTALLGAGCKLIDVYARLAAAGLTIPAGSCPTVGLGGLAQGGGVGLASRAFGTTADNVVAANVVTADGRLRSCNATHDPDLFWALRGGGGGNFGIVTSLQLRTHRVSSAAYYFARWPWSEAAEAIQAWQALAPHAPDALFSLCSLSTGTSAPQITSFGQFMGSAAQLRAVLRPLTATGQPSVSIGTSSYLQLMLRWAGCLGSSLAACHLASQAGGTLRRAAFAAKSDYVSRALPGTAIAAVLHRIEQAQASLGPGRASAIFDSYGGAINRVAPSATAFVHRNALFSCQELTYWSTPAQQAASLRWLRSLHATLAPFASGEAYQNYIDPELTSWRTAYYGANYARLVDVKGRYDPHWLFRFRQGIPPA